MTDGSAPGDPAPRPTAGRRRALRSARTRWLVAGGVAALATVLGLSLALRSGAAPACAAPRALAAPPAGTTVHKGKATFYDSKGAGGNCSYPSAPANRRYVALGPSEYAAGAACGGFLDVTGPRGTVRVLVMDQCPECEPGHLDLSREAFAEIADPVQGVVGISYRAVVDPPLPGPLTFRIKEGASQWWFAVLVGQHGKPAALGRGAAGQLRRLARCRAAGLQLLADRIRRGPRAVRHPGDRRVRPPRQRHRHPDGAGPGAAQHGQDVRRCRPRQGHHAGTDAVGAPQPVDLSVGVGVARPRGGRLPAGRARRGGDAGGAQPGGRLRWLTVSPPARPGPAT